MFETNFIYILPIAVISILLFLFFKNREKKSHKWRKKSSIRISNLIQNIKEEGKIFAYIRKIDPFVFEELLLHSLEKIEGVEIIRNKKYTGDGGIDGKFKYKGNIYLIQAKRYKNNISYQHLKEFSQITKETNSKKGFFIHSGKTSEKTKTEVKSLNNIHIISGNELLNLLKNNFQIDKYIK